MWTLKRLLTCLSPWTPPQNGKSINSAGETNAEDFRIRNAHNIKTVVCAGTRGLRMMDVNGGHLTPNAAARLTLTPSRGPNCTGVTSAGVKQIRTVER